MNAVRAYLTLRYLCERENANEVTINCGRFTEEKPGSELPPETLHLYQRLIDMYSSVYGRGEPLLEHKIEKYIGKGLNREEAIRRLAEEEGIA